MGQVLYATFLENRRVYRLAKARWQRLIVHRLVEQRSEEEMEQVLE